MKSRARVGATLSALAATATAALLIGAPAQAAPAATPAPTRTTLSSAIHNVAYGGVVKLKAVVKPVTGTALPTGTVTFNEGATVLGTVSLALLGTVETAKLDVPGLGVGDHDFTAHYNGSASFAASTSLPLTITIGLPGTTTTLSVTNTPDKTLILGQPAKLKAVVKPKVSGTGTPTGTVTFYEGATVLGTSSLALASGVWSAKWTVNSPPLGSHLYTAMYNGLPGVLAGSTSKVLTVTVSQCATSITITPSTDANGEYLFTADVVKAVAAAPGFPSGNVDFFIDNFAVQHYALGATGHATTNQPVSLDPGTHSVKVVYYGDVTFLPSQNTLTFTILT